MAAHRFPLVLALSVAISGMAATMDATPALAQEARAAGVDAQATELERALRGMQLPPAQAVQLSSPRDISARMVDAEVFFNLREWVNCATLLAPALEEPGMATHPAVERAHYLLAESLFQMESYEVARTSFQRILDLNHRSYDKEATKRLLEIAVIERNFYEVDQQYGHLLRKYGTSTDSSVHYLLGRAQYFRTNYLESANDFQRVATDSPLYWRAQYHRGVSYTRAGELEHALQVFGNIENSLTSGEIAPVDYEVLQYARLAQGTLHYEMRNWDEAVRAYSSVERGADAFEHALYQVAWTQIREGRVTEAITNLEVLSLIAQNSRIVAEARLLSAEMMRREGDYDQALETFEAVTDDFTLIREQLYEIRDEDMSIPARFDASEGILTGSILAPFLVEHWSVSDENARRGLEILRESEELGEWVLFNRSIAQEIDDALASGFAYDRARELRELRAVLVDAQRKSVDWRETIVMNLRQQGVSNDPTVRQYTDNAANVAKAIPQNTAEIEQSVANERERLNQEVLDIYRKEQGVLLEIDNMGAREMMIRDRVRMKLDTPEQANRERRELHEQRRLREAELAELREERLSLHRQRIRYGIGEAQEVAIQALNAYRDALTAEMKNAGVHAGADARALETLDATITELHGNLRQRVTTAWASAYERLGVETRAVDGLDRRQQVKHRMELKDAEDVAMAGFLALLEQVDNVALRASLGEVDVAWWQKEGVSRRIESLFRERERQIRRLDADFSEIRE